MEHGYSNKITRKLGRIKNNDFNINVMPERMQLVRNVITKRLKETHEKTNGLVIREVGKFNLKLGRQSIEKFWTE